MKKITWKVKFAAILIIAILVSSCSGDDGSDGLNGINGVDGTQGVAGQNGLDGEDGINGQDAETYAVGDFAQGGIVFWIDEIGQHGLVCSKEDQYTLVFRI